MTNFELINDLVKRLEEMEYDLNCLKDCSEPLTKEAVNASLPLIKDLYQKLLDIDKALEEDKMGYVLF